MIARGTLGVREWGLVNSGKMINFALRKGHLSSPGRHKNAVSQLITLSPVYPPLHGERGI